MRMSVGSSAGNSVNYASCLLRRNPVAIFYQHICSGRVQQTPIPCGGPHVPLGTTTLTSRGGPPVAP